MKLADTWSWVCGRAKSSYYTRHELQARASRGTCAPHLHFEIFSIGNAIGKGLKYRINPGFFINFKNFNTMSEEERNLQQDTAKAGKIINFKGSD